MNATTIIRVAARHAAKKRCPMRAEAEACLRDAKAAIAANNPWVAYQRAKDSLRYSCVELHRDYRRA